MRYLAPFVVATLIFAGCNKAKTQPAQTLTASVDTNGLLHPAQLQLPRAAIVKCVSAVGNNGSPGKCNVNGASTGLRETVEATDKVYLLCEGAPPVKCSAKVE